jgi:hypothetical protein
MSTPRGPGRDFSALKKSPGLRALRPDTVETEKAAAQVATKQQSAASEPTGAKRGTIAYLPAEVKARLEEAAAATRQTYTEWFLDRFDAFYDHLAKEFLRCGSDALRCRNGRGLRGGGLEPGH